MRLVPTNTGAIAAGSVRGRAPASHLLKPTGSEPTADVMVEVSQIE